MQIDINTNYDFEACINRLSDKYGLAFKELNGFSNNKLNFSEFINRFTEDNEELADFVLNPTSNSVKKDIVSMQRNMNDPHYKLLATYKMYYEITKKFGKEDADLWLEMIWIGEIYLHDFPSSTFLPYCFAVSLQSIAERGLYFIDQFPCGPANHLDTFCHHVLETISWLSNRQAGAVGLPDLLIYMYYFWNKDVENDLYGFKSNPKHAEQYARQNIQSVIFDLNQPYLRIVESAFTNVTIMDNEYLVAFFGEKDFPDGTPIMDKIDEIKNFQKWFMEELHKTRKGQVFTFPVVTYSLLFQDGKFIDEEFARWCSDENFEWMDSNFYTGADVTSLSSCCRLVNDTSKLKGHFNSIGGTELNIGSCKVSTINLRRIALKCSTLEDYLRILEEEAIMNLKALDVQRSIIKRNIEKQLLPNFTSGLLKIDRMYSTIGITGMFEALDELKLIGTDEFGNKFYTSVADEMAVKILDKLNEIKDKWCEDKDYSVNIEAVPGESCNTKLAKEDLLLYPNAKNVYILGNQWIPLAQPCTINEKIRLGALLDHRCGGGQIAHINIQSHFANRDMAWEMLNTVAKAGVQYFAFNPIIYECSHQHHWIGASRCPVCGEVATERYSRVVGFFRPQSSMSVERKREFSERTWFSMKTEDTRPKTTLDLSKGL